jgi:hypothetical protein
MLNVNGAGRIHLPYQEEPEVGRDQHKGKGKNVPCA